MDDDGKTESENPDWSEQAENLGAKEIIKDVYKDGLQEPTKEIGKALTTVAKAINVALSPLAAVVWSYEKLEAVLKAKMNKKLKDTDPDDIVPPPIHVAGPTVEAFRYAQDQPELQDMFASLLASSMDKNTQKNVHPAFIEIIKQLSPNEASILKRIFRQHESEFEKQLITERLKLRPYTVARFVQNIELDYVNHSKYASGFDHINSKYMMKYESAAMFYTDETGKFIENAPTTAVSLDNLLRLKLLTLTTKPSSNYIAGEDNDILEMTTILYVSEFGIDFINTCVK